ncbi:MAG: nucleoside hydrolase [Candidatus Hermodarchaeota archaeon]
MKRIFIDTDIGSDIDDALALLLALHLADVEILGINTVYGPTELRAKICHKLISAAGRTIPIAAGESEPRYSPIPVWVAGTEGVGVLTENEAKAPLDNFGISTDPVKLLTTQALTYPGEVTLVALGALTNIARALEEEPQLATALREIVFMGAGLTYPNPIEFPITLNKDEIYHAGPSHNIRCDVIAARQVLESSTPKRIVTNDATTRLWLEGPGIERFHTARAPHIQLVGQMLDIWLEYRSNVFQQPIQGTCPHDPFTLAVAVDRVQYESVRGILTVQEDSSTNFHTEENSPVELVLAEKGKKFLPWLSERLHVSE